ncbi:MAG: sugar phosphate nucleotidyltransferase, partial [Ruminiclostridium sp.]
EYDMKGYAISFMEKPEAEQIFSNFINAGIYIFEPEILREIPIDSVVSAEREIFPKLLAKGRKIAAYKDSGYWADIGTLGKYMQVHKDIMDGKCRMVGCNNACDNINIGNHVRIHPQAELIGPVYIGDNVTIDAKVVVSHSVIGNNVHIREESRVTGSILWNDVKIGREARLIGSIITSNAFVLKNTNFLNTVYSREINPLYQNRQAT